LSKVNYVVFILRAKKRYLYKTYYILLDKYYILINVILKELIEIYKMLFDRTKSEVKPNILFLQHKILI